MKYKIILQESWMGDTLFAANVVKNISKLGIEIVLVHKWKFMNKLLDLFEINHNHEDIFKDDYQIINYSHRIDPYDNPIVDYAKSFNIKDIDINDIIQFNYLDLKFKEKYNTVNNNNLYITYENDWQFRTKLDTKYIINELEKINIKCIPIGGDRFSNNEEDIINSSELLINSKLHLGIIAGTTNLATFLNTKTIGLSDHLFNFYINQHGHGTNRTMSCEEFLIEFKPFPHNWADKKHITCHPNINEEEYIKIILDEYKQTISS